MKEFIYSILAKPLFWLNQFTGSYALSLVFYIIVMRLFFVIFDYFRADAKVRTMVAKPFLSKVKEKYLGKDSKKFEAATLELFDVSKSSQITKMAPFIIEYPLILAVFYALYHPVSVLFPTFKSQIESMASVSANVFNGPFPEINIVNAVRSNPSLFSKFGDVSSIKNLDCFLFGRIDLFSHAEWGSYSVIFPILLLAFFAWAIIRLLIPVFKGKTKFRKVSLFFGLYLFIGLSFAASAFSLPLVFYLYFLIFNLIGTVSTKVIDSLIVKKKKPWVTEANKQCQDILRKYDIEDYVSALPEKEPETDCTGKDCDVDADNF